MGLRGALTPLQLSSREGVIGLVEQHSSKLRHIAQVGGNLDNFGLHFFGRLLQASDETVSFETRVIAGPVSG